MSDSQIAELPDNPWDTFKSPAPTAHPPADTDLPDNPWDTFGSSSTPKLSDQTPETLGMGDTILKSAKDAFTIPAHAVADLATNPVTMAKALPVAASVAGSISPVPGGATIGMVAGRQMSNEALRLLGHSEDIPSTTQQVAEGVGSAVFDAAGPIMKFFKPPPDLLDAGITARTIKNMTPQGVNPAKFGESLESELKGLGALKESSKDTWDAMNALKEQAGQAVGSSLQQIAEQAVRVGTQNPLAIDAESALQPIIDGWVERAGGGLSGTRRLAKPFEEAYANLTNTATQQGGKLTLDNIRSLMDEVGPLVHKGTDQAREAYSELYGTLANARDQMVQTVAKQANNPALAGNLLKANANYTKYIRLMPDITNAAAKYALKEGVSTFQKLGGPQVLRYATGLAGYEGLKKTVESILGPE